SPRPSAASGAAPRQGAAARTARGRRGRRCRTSPWTSRRAMRAGGLMNRGLIIGHSSRLKFIHALIKGEGSSINDERIEVLSHCYSNVKYLSNVYGDEIMNMLRKYDPEIPA
ncbi:unnamed protein product, partial [Prorocentrum cordatum]